LYIPGPSAQRLSQRQLKPQRQRSQAQYYRVKSGDTLWSISRRFGVDHLQLAQWNKLDPRATLKLGKRLRLYERRVKVAQADSGGLTKIHYRVRKGDSIAAIARRFGTSISAIVRANGLNPKQYLQPGQALTLLVHPQRG
ncbi:MAG: LysM peptidoglycan-binding domain-containing protein, partial [Cellvibrionaceae bacterium]|nr:LysM peptidoglycan-binding domain-containing protein [Cellvibrionaceae bacterium]